MLSEQQSSVRYSTYCDSTVLP